MVLLGRGGLPGSVSFILHICCPQKYAIKHIKDNKTINLTIGSLINKVAAKIKPLISKIHSIQVRIFDAICISVQINPRLAAFNHVVPIFPLMKTNEVSKSAQATFSHDRRLESRVIFPLILFTFGGKF